MNKIMMPNSENRVSERSRSLNKKKGLIIWIFSRAYMSLEGIEIIGLIYWSRSEARIPRLYCPACPSSACLEVEFVCIGTYLKATGDVMLVYQLLYVCSHYICNFYINLRFHGWLFDHNCFFNII